MTPVEHLSTPLPGRRPEPASTSALLTRLRILSLLLDRVGVERVDLVEDDDLGLFGQPLVIGGELAADGLVGGLDVVLRAVDQMDQHPQRSTWPRNRSPMPAPSCAPSISPGISASTKSRSPTFTTPRLGWSVVNG